MAVQQRRTSKTRKRLRRTHFKLTVTGLVTCSNCGALIKSHHVCPKCHYYAGKLVIADEKEVAETKKAVKAKAKKVKKEEKVEKVEEVKVEKKAVKKTVKKVSEEAPVKKAAAKKPAAKKASDEAPVKKTVKKAVKTETEETKVE